jgi:hypothetical protein
VADLITHTCTAVLWKAARNRPHVATFVAGTCLPDLFGRVPTMALTALRWKLPFIPDWLVYLWNPLHMPFGIVLTCYVVSFLFPEATRRVAFLNLLGGGLLHMAVDLLQFHFGVGYLLLFPFSFWDFELGWIGSETTVLIVPFLLPFTVAVAWWRWGRRGPESAADPASSAQAPPS